MIKTGTSKYAGIRGKPVNIDRPPHRHQRRPFHAELHKRFKTCFQIALLQGGLPAHDFRLTGVRACGAEDYLCGQLYPESLHT